MRVTDLMVGDWFKAVDYNSPFRITAIYDDVAQTQADYQSEIDGNWYSEVEIKNLVPIPLTEEILVKNGFEKRYFDYDFSYDLYEDDNVSFVRLYDHGEGVFFTETSGGDILIKYVHQLQHLLRLSGIEKEIEL